MMQQLKDYLSFFLVIGFITPIALAKPAPSIDDFRVLEGDNWEGELNYLNYNSDNRSSIPVGMKIHVSKDGYLVYAIRYPGEESHNTVKSSALRPMAMP